MTLAIGRWLWLFAVLTAIGFTGLRWHRQNIADTSLLSLLPAPEGDPLLTEANQLLSERASHLMAFVVGNQDAGTAATAAEWFKTALAQSGLITMSLTDLPADQQKAFFDLYFPFRYQMLSPGDRERLKAADPVSPFVGRLTEALYSPAATFFKELIPKDPLLLFPELVHSWMETALPEPPKEAAEGIAFVDGGVSYAFTAVQLALNPFDSKDQDRMIHWLHDARAQLATRFEGSRLYSSGVLPFASAERTRTEREMMWVSVGSLIGVLSMTVLVFASVRTLLLAALPISVGFVVAVAVTTLVFGRIHIITFAFGSSLIGVAIDYPLLYLAQHRVAGKTWNAEAALQKISSGLLFGALTTLMGYAALSLAPFPGLRQMALFSSAGLAAAFLTVFFWLPPLLQKPSDQTQEPRWLPRGCAALVWAARQWKDRTSKQWGVLGLVALIFLGGGLMRMRFDDDIRLLQHPPKAIADEDAFVRRGAKGLGGERFLLIRGANTEELLERQEQVQQRLSGGAQTLAPFLPSQKSQETDHQQLATLTAHTVSLRNAFQKLGLNASVANTLLHDLAQPTKILSVSDWLASPASQLLRSLWIGETAHGVASAALITGDLNSRAIETAVQGVPGVRFFDQLEAYTQLFRRYRRLGMILTLAAYLLVWGVMVARYGARTGSLVTAPSVGAVLFSFACFGWCGVPVHIIHCLSALLVLSMGVDYGIYFAEAARADALPTPTLLAVGCCAWSTLLSFGLLALCHTPVLSAIGLTVFSGMTVAFLFSPLPYISR